MRMYDLAVCIDVPGFKRFAQASIKKGWQIYCDKLDVMSSASACNASLECKSFSLSALPGGETEACFNRMEAPGMEAPGTPKDITDCFYQKINTGAYRKMTCL